MSNLQLFMVCLAVIAFVVLAVYSATRDLREAWAEDDVRAEAIALANEVLANNKNDRSGRDRWV